MKNAFLPDAKRYQRAHRRRRLWHRIVTGLAAVVVFCTTYALILPAITLENDYVCGQDEHQHGGDCFQAVQTERFSTVLVCAPEVHSHTADCCDAEGRLCCGLADCLLHRHDEYCFDEAGRLICALPAVVEHVHGESCYQEAQELICPLEQIAVHEHTIDCCDGSGALTCTILSAQAHQHTEACRQKVSAGFAEETTLACSLQEHSHTGTCLPQEEPEHTGDAPQEPMEDIDQPTPEQLEEGEIAPAPDYLCGLAEHSHSELCYDALGALSCGLEEHQHTQACVGQTVSAWVKAVIDSIDALPAAEEIGGILAAYEDSGYLEGGEAYFQEMATRTRGVYDAYQALTAEEQAQVTNADKLLELEWLWSAETLIDGIKSAAPTVAASASTRDFIDLNLYDYSGAINANYDRNNKYPGFQWNGGAYMDSNSFNRHKVDYIDFGNSNITDIDYGGTNTGITNGLSRNSVKVANNGGTINKLDVSDYGVTNRPIGMSTGVEVLSRTLGSDGYPVLADGSSLAYLFTNGEAVTKQNTESIDGLFRCDEKTGAYYYNSRWNHAQYSDNKFTLYDQIITPNFIVYPFGNFLPFNTITDSTKATQVGSINGSTNRAIGDYGQKIINDLWSSSDYAKNSTKQQLLDMLARYRDDLKTVSTSSGNAWDTWSAKDAIVDYFTAGGGSGDKPSSNTSPITDELLNKMYNIDWDEETNFFFGMDMSMNFFQPKGGLTGNDGKQLMEFYFAGDDDVWVYIDGVLFLDFTGIHRHVGGKIDFVNGKVYYYALDTANGGDVSSTPYATYTFEQLLTAAGKSTDGLNEKGTFKDYTTHSFKFYYMERGSGSSVCRMNFNFPLLRKNSISVTKELSVDDTSKLPLLGDPDFKFQVLKEGGTELFIGANREYEIQNAAGEKIGTDWTDADGVFTLKAGQMAVFTDIDENAGKYFVRELLDPTIFGQYGTISVNGSSTTSDYGVTVGSDSFTGVNSSVKDVSDGSTVFTFNNQVTTSKLGSLTITKTLTEYPKAKAALRFDLEVTLDGNPLPVGTRYTVGDDTRTVTKVGIITLAPSETATVTNILAGTRFTVTETAASAEGYVVSYSVDGTATSGPASGTVGINTEVSVTVNNAEQGASVDIPVTKILLAPDGRQHTYQFQLTQVKGKTDLTEIGGTTQKLEIPVTTGPVTKKFVLDYPLVDLETLPQIFYYQIKEEQPENTGTIYDQSVYVAEVTVSKADSGMYQAAVTQIWKVGAENTATAVTFTNQIQRYELPETGGWGVLPCYIAGAALIAAAGLLYRSNKRRRGAECPQ